MNKRPKPEETEEDILRMQEEFFAEKAKNPQLKSAAQAIKVPKKSLFKQNRESGGQTVKDNDPTKSDVLLKQQIQSTLGHSKLDNEPTATVNTADLVLGDIVEKRFDAPKRQANPEFSSNVAFPKVPKMQLNLTPKTGQSIFAQTLAAKLPDTPQVTPKKPVNEQEMNKMLKLYGTESVVLEKSETAAEVHKQNLELLSQMKEEQILAEREELLKSIDPALLALLAKKRQVKAKPAGMEVDTTIADSSKAAEDEELPASNPVWPILERSNAEQWINFDVVEKDKLSWMRDIPMQAKKLKADQKFEARFDWKGVLLPYYLEQNTQNTQDDRELYLHGDEPERPGYTLQELFRLARSNVTQQRISAFGAIAGILNIYNQGFYDQVLDLPIAKIFFLLRFGFDDNTPAMLEIVSKAMAFLFYNDADETLLDFIYDNPSCHWQPTLQVLSSALDDDDDDPLSIGNLQRQMKNLQMTSRGQTSNLSNTFQIDIPDNEEDSKTSMSDFQLAETDLVECFLRTNIIQRITFILHDVRSDNSTVTSCLKLLIRLARSGKDAAMQIVTKDLLLSTLMDNFLPGFEVVDTDQTTPPFYNYPQHLCLKLIRVLCSTNLGIALKFTKLGIIEKLQNYLYTQDNLKNSLVKVQIEALRLLRCLLLLRVDNMLYKKFIPAFRYMLEWHYNHVNLEVGGAYLIRQHAAALMAAIASIPNDGVCLEIVAVLGEILHDCFCSWFYKATELDIKEFSQLTLLSACLSAVTWLTRYSDLDRLLSFHQRYLPAFVRSKNFQMLVSNLSVTSTILKSPYDRRNAFAALPNCGSILLHKCGPQLIITQNYPILFLSAIWRLMELQLQREQKYIFDALLTPNLLEHLVGYLRHIQNGGINGFVATNFFAKTELHFVCKLLSFEGFRTYFTKTEMLQLCYNVLCCLNAEHIDEIEILFEKYIFNSFYLQTLDEQNLTVWRKHSMNAMVRPHAIVISPSDMSLSLPSMRPPILPRDWSYYNLYSILKSYIENLQKEQQLLMPEATEREVIQMTFKFVTALEDNASMSISSPTEQLMYLMISFMGPHSQFLNAEVHEILKQNLLRFFAKYQHETFQFDAKFEGKCKFENLYALFVEHFQAASYGDELFSALVLVPMAQKYDNKWRRRLWSEYAAALRFVNCDESLLCGGLNDYLNPPETEESLLKSYAMALNTNMVRVDSIPYRIAKHHLEEYRKEKTG